MPAFPARNFKRQLDKSFPAANNAKLGTWLYEVSAQLTALQVAHNALLAKLDTANLAGVGTNNVATLGGTLTNTLPEDRA